MSNAEEIPTPHEEPVFIVGISGRLPHRTICALELDRTEIPGHLRKWQALLGDRLHISTLGQLPHPSRLVKREYAAPMRQLTKALAEFPQLHVIHMTKRPAPQAEQDILDWLCKLLDGRPSGLALIQTSRGIFRYRLTAGGPEPDPLWTLPHSPAEAELLLTPAKLGAYAAYQHRCYPNQSCRPSWLPPELPWADLDIPTDNRT
ncbi:hypothetical protein [Streptomyces sp. NPDC001450]